MGRLSNILNNDNGTQDQDQGQDVNVNTGRKRLSSLLGVQPSKFDFSESIDPGGVMRDITQQSIEREKARPPLPNLSEINRQKLDEVQLQASLLPKRDAQGDIQVDMSQIEALSPEQLKQKVAIQEERSRLSDLETERLRKEKVEADKPWYQKAAEDPRLSKIFGGLLLSKLAPGAPGAGTSVLGTQTGQEFAAGVAGSVPLAGNIFEESIKSVREESTLPRATVNLPIIGKTELDVVGAGGLAGGIGFTAAQYGAINKALEGLGATTKLGKLLGGSKPAKFAATQGVDLLADVIIQTPVEVFDAIENDQSLSQFARNTLNNRKWDVVVNAIVGGAFELSNLRKLKNADKTGLDEALTKVSPEQAKQIRDALEIKVDVPLSPAVRSPESFVDLNVGVGKSVNIDGQPYRIIGEQGTNYRAIDSFGEETFIPKIIADQSEVLKARPDFDKSIIDNATMDNIKNFDSIQELNPATRPFIKSRAEELKNDLQNTVIGQRQPIIDDFGDVLGTAGTKRITSEGLAKIKDDLNVSYKQIEESLERIIKDQGVDKFALDKRIQLMINDDLENGYKTFAGEFKPRNEEYIKSLTQTSQAVPTGKLTEILSKDPEVYSNYKVDQPFIEDQLIEDFMTTTDLPTIGKGEPIDTKTLISTELPKRVKNSAADNLDRFYQEVVSKMYPVEKIGGASRVQGSNLNKTLGSIEYNVIGKQTNMLGDEIGKSVQDIFSTVKESEKADLFEYIFHKHNIDRAAEGKPVFGESIDSNFSKKFVEDFEAANPGALQVQEDITGYFRNLLREWGVESGLVSVETADFLNDLYKNYVPTIRAKNLPKSLSQGNQTVAQVLKKAKGSEDIILPLDQMMIMQTDRMIKNARRNELLNTIADTFEKNPDVVGKYVKEIKGGPKEIVDDVVDIGKSLEVEPEAFGGDFLINFYKNGEPRQMVVNKTMYEAFKPDNYDNMVNKVSSAFKKYATNPFKSLITEYNPGFSVANILRDVPTSLVFSDNALRMSKNVPKAVKEMLTNGELWRKFKALGGTREGLIGAGKQFKVPTLGDKTTLQKVMTNANKANPFKLISHVNKFTESLPRFAEFISVLDKTGNPALAVYKSADLTTDFARHGKSTKLLDSFVAYLNPQVQGIDKFARSIIKDPLKTAIGGAAAITVPTIILDQINKDNPLYNDLSPRERNLYFQIPYTDSNGDQQFIRIPKSRELGVLFSSLFDWSARTARGQEVTGEEMYQAIKENFGVGITPLWTPLAKAIRQIQDPEAYEQNFWGGYIVPESQRKYSPGNQYDLNSSGLAKAIGRQFDISPFVVDYLLKSYLGVGAQLIQPIGADKKTGFADPILGRFKTDPVLRSDVVNQFYVELDKAKKEAQDYNKENNIPSKLVTPLERQASNLQKVANEMTKLRNQQKELKKEKGNEDKIRKIQEDINNLARQALEGR